MMFSFRIRSGTPLTGALTTALITYAAVPMFGQAAMRFTCGKTGSHEMTLTAASRYVAPEAKAGGSPGSAPASGFDLVASPTTFSKGACSSDKPFFFSVAVPDGNYQISVTLGSGAASVMTVRGESRRLFVDRQKIAAGGSQNALFNVNVRTEYIADAVESRPPMRLRAAPQGTPRPRPPE